MISKNSGFVLFEALIAMSIVVIGFMALSKVQVKTMSDISESKSNSEAVRYSATHMDNTNKNLLKSDFDSISSGSLSNDGGFSTVSTVSTVSATGTTDIKKISMETSWTDRTNQVRKINLNSLVAWNNPVTQNNLTHNTEDTLTPPSGKAIRGDAVYEPGDDVTVSLLGNKRVLHNSNVSADDLELSDAILYLEPDAAGNPQNFVTVTGNVYFDQQVNQNKIPSVDEVYVRLSTEGICTYDNSAFNSEQYNDSSGFLAYKYFDYICYVGPSWYGNVGIMPKSDKSPNVCVGDPSGTNDGSTTRTISQLSAKRSYRGFRNTSSNPSAPNYISTGVLGGSATESYPPSGTIANPPASATRFNQHFLITALSGTKDCADRMSLKPELFVNNAGEYFCITPDDFEEFSDQCPANWPNFAISGGGGGSGTCVSPNVPTRISGTAHDKQGTVTPNPSSYGSCLMEGNTANYSCSFCSSAGDTVVLTNQYIKNNGSIEYSYSSGTITLSGGNQKYNFP